jgi:hypothetical protein
MEKIKKMPTHSEEIFYMQESERHLHGCKGYETNVIFFFNIFKHI